jgi:hypothetical protein
VARRSRYFASTLRANGLQTKTALLSALKGGVSAPGEFDEEGQESEWHSRVIRRYQRRTERVDGAILGLYLSGTNTRRLRGALAPLLRGAPLSKDAVSRLVGRLREDFAVRRFS